MPQRRIDRILVTGGAGFIGSAFIRSRLPFCDQIVNLDRLTYAGSRSALIEDPRLLFVQGDIRDEELVEELCVKHDLQAIVHFAAESHVDRSIENPKIFVETNVMGTVSLLEVLRRRPSMHFHHVSTDEVYGSLEKEGRFSEESPYCPNSPYAASKAASDHFVRAYAHTFGLSVTLSHCTNNYGPFQFPEKLIPLMIVNCLNKKPLPLYGDGLHVRDWLFVEDHVEAIGLILEKGVKGEVYDIGGGCELSNRALLHLLVEALASLTGEDPQTYLSLIAFVPDRPGHDFRYAIDSTKIKKQLGWAPRHSFKEGLRKTILWYLETYENCLYHSGSAQVD